MSAILVIVQYKIIWYTRKGGFFLPKKKMLQLCYKKVPDSGNPLKLKTFSRSGNTKDSVLFYNRRFAQKTFNFTINRMKIQF